MRRSGTVNANISENTIASWMCKDHFHSQFNHKNNGSRKIWSEMHKQWINASIWTQYGVSKRPGKYNRQIEKVDLYTNFIGYL